ncbi:integral membrane protein [Fusarium coicis]|nr:integral membrane protein [Fusarium coicis]
MPAGPSGVVVLIVIYVLIAVSTTIIGARIYLRLVIQKQRLVTADWLRISAWCTAFVTGFFDILYAKEGVLHPGINYTLSNWDAPLEQQIRMRKGGHKSRTSMQLQNDGSDVPNQLGVAFRRKHRSQVHSLLFARDRTDTFIVFCLPFLIIHNLNMRRKVKVSVYCIFLLGIIDIAFSLTRFLTIQLGDSEDFRSFTIIELWCSLDVYIGLVICCIPALRPYLHRKGANYNIQESGRPSKSGHAIRRTGQSGFEEITEGSDLRGDGGDDSWSVSHSCEITEELSDKKENGSDIELVSIEVSKSRL